MRFDSEMISVGIDASTQKEVLCLLASKLVEMGLVKESFPQAILDREAIYPTGLPAVAFDIAIPHCASENVNETSMAVATLARPVEWRQMGSPEITLLPEVIFMLAIKDPKQQLETLQKLMAVIQNKDLLEGIRAAGEAGEVYDLLAPALMDEP